jgi:hypothetical protein
MLVGWYILLYHAIPGLKELLLPPPLNSFRASLYNALQPILPHPELDYVPFGRCYSIERAILSIDN